MTTEKGKMAGARWLPLLVAFLVAAVVTWPLVLAPGGLIGHPLGEVNNHFWMYWRASEMLGGHWPLSNIPEGVEIPLMDPVNLPLYMLGALFGPIAGYNLVLFGNILIAFWGGHSLARAWGVSRVAALTAGVSLASAPFLGGVISFGITESLSLGWLALHVAALKRWSDGGGWRQLLFASASLVAFLFSGWYAAFFALLVEIWAFFSLFLFGGRERTLVRFAQIVGQGAVAGAVLVPRFLGFLSTAELWENRWRAVTPEPRPYREFWRDMSSEGADLMHLIMPTGPSADVSKAVYFGVVTLALALFAGRRALAPLLAALLFSILSMGHWLSIAGHAQFFGSAWKLPTAWLTDSFTSLEGLTHWYRAAGPATIFLALAAAMGLDRLLALRPGRLVWLAAVVPLLIVLDANRFAPTAWPIGLVEPRLPEIYNHIEGEGAIVQLPLHNGRRDHTDDVPRLYNLWQPLHGQEVIENYEGADSVLLRSDFIARANYLCGVPTGPHMGGSRKGAHYSANTLNEIGRLRSWGINYIVVHTVRERTERDAWMCGDPLQERQQQLADAQRVEEFLTEALGEPVAEVGGDLLYRLQ